MAFINSPTFEDDFRKVVPDATSGFAPTGTVSSSVERAGSENLAAPTSTDEDEELEDDEGLDDEEDDDEDDLEDDDLDDDEEDDDADNIEEDDDDEDDEEEDDDDELEDDDDAVKARLSDAEKRARKV